MLAGISQDGVWPVQGHDASTVTALVAPEEATPSTKISTKTAPKPAAGHQIPWRHGTRRIRFATGGRILPGWAREFDSGRRTPRPAGPEEGAGGWAPSRGGPAARRAPAGPLRVMNHHAQRVPACRRLSCRQATGQFARPGGWERGQPGVIMVPAQTMAYDLASLSQQSPGQQAGARSACAPPQRRAEPVRGRS